MNASSTDHHFVSLLSHDLRTPLGPLTLAVSNLAEGSYPAEETQGLAKIALAQTDRLRRLIDAALIAAGRDPASDPATVGLDAVLNEAAAVHRAAGGIVDVHALPGVTVRADRSVVRDALAGLMEVAAGEDYMPIECALDIQLGRAAITISSQDLLRCAIALGADHASDSPSAFAIAGERVLARSGGGVELIDDGIVVWLPHYQHVEVA